MKQLSVLFLACALAIPALAQDATTTNSATAATAHAPGQMFLASAAAVTAPLVFTNDYFHLESDMADVAAGGKAVFNFTITNAGNYLIESVVNAPDDSANSFFVNMDAPPTDPDMIWDIEVTSGFEKRLVNWRGDGDASNGQFVPKTFKLGPGAHTLILVGREPDVRLKSLTIFPAPPEKPATP
jgi:uncharacterized cupredoxin-like copper-binding protein